jgi:lysophospholipase
MQMTIKIIAYLTCILFLSVAGMDTVCAQENPDNVRFTTEQQLKDPSVRETIHRFYSKGTEGTFNGADGVEIYYRYYRQPETEKGAIVLSTGRTEGAVKYKELIHDLFNNGYSVYIHDHRGQGLSGRMAEDPQMGHVDQFQYYIDDLKQFVDVYVQPGGHEKVYLMAHSMGGTIGLSYLEQHPSDFDAAAFSSPMLGLSAYICPLARILSGNTPKYAPGQTGYTNDSSSFAGNAVTGSEVRYHMKIAAYDEVPEAKVGGPSVQWLEQSCRQMKQVVRTMEEIRTPFILFAAENETVVNPKAYEKFMKKAEREGLDASMVRIENAQHELLMEKDPQRNEVLRKSLNFFSRK